MRIIVIFVVLILILLIGIIGGVFFLEKQRYNSVLTWILPNVTLFFGLLIPITFVFFSVVGFWTIPVSTIPLVGTIASMALGVLCLRKHISVMILPLLMSTHFLFLLLLLLTIGLISNYTSEWLLGVLFNELLYMKFYIWGSICALTVFYISVILTFCFGIRKKDLIQCIEYKRGYLRLYLYVAGLPSAAFLLFWFQYSALDPISVHNIFGVIIYFLLLIACAIVYFFTTYKTKTKSKFRKCIYIAVNVLLAAFLTKNREYGSMTWLFSCYVSCFISHVLYEVKISKQETLIEKTKLVNTCSVPENMWIVLFSYVPLLVMVVSNLIILACERAYMF